ncbi:hypothetical protein WUBG_08544 [Wuchereria bancrofti]|uniref:Uncharacterized protein n=1 Tax=Wuchereria bancrofti TaxID=6293 RepID=J9EEI8_WUCBA|nr:hypothetical protein WUBG_08544 [Wuchereria bancrofti]VDM07000.1 unnamed protein product [Wuchereria bancrofti]
MSLAFNVINNAQTHAQAQTQARFEVNGRKNQVRVFIVAWKRIFHHSPSPSPYELPGCHSYRLFNLNGEMYTCQVNSQVATSAKCFLCPMVGHMYHEDYFDVLFGPPISRS